MVLLKAVRDARSDFCLYHWQSGLRLSTAPYGPLGSCMNAAPSSFTAVSFISVDCSRGLLRSKAWKHFEKSRILDSVGDLPSQRYKLNPLKPDLTWQQIHEIGFHYRHLLEKYLNLLYTNGLDIRIVLGQSNFFWNDWDEDLIQTRLHLLFVGLKKNFFCERVSQKMIGVNKDLISFLFKLLIHVPEPVQTWALT